jgi:Metallopeptidase family M24
MVKIILPLLLFLNIGFEIKAQSNPLILNEKQRSKFIDEILEERFSTVLPQIMREENIDMWVIISREYNEDPVMKTMLPSEWLSARRRSIFIFFDNGKTIERAAIARYDVGNLLKGEWDLNTHPDQWSAVNAYITSKNPKKIGLNYSQNFAHADGISKTEYDLFTNSISAANKTKIVSAENIAVKWLETRTPREMEIYEHISLLSHEIIKEAFSSKVITPGVTSTEDVVWWMRQKVTDLGLETWFHPTVDVQRADTENFEHLRAFSKRTKETIIQGGDLLHCDFGITYLRLNTDHQQIAYMLKPGETDIPLFLKEAFKEGNKLQDVLVSNFKTGLSGNTILANALAESKKMGIKGTIYTHPIGSHGHAAGPTIGMWDNQGITKGAGDFPLHPNTAYSIELNAAVEILEWKKTIRIMLEEDGFFDGKSFRFINGRQKEIIKIGSI